MGIQEITLATAILGAATGFTGVLLGGLNIWRNIRRDQVRLKVEATWAITTWPTVQTQFQVRVINLSEFPLTVSDVGFTMKDGKLAHLGTVDGIEPNGTLPLRSEPRTGYSKVLALDALGDSAPKVQRPYARTECGEHVTGKRRGMRGLIKAFQRRDVQQS